MDCKYCGKPLMDGAKFCSFCGEVVQTEEPPKTKVVEEVAVSVGEVELENNVATTDSAKEEKVEAKASYDLVIYNSGQSLITFITFIQSLAKCSLAEAKKIAKNLPVTLFSNLDEDTANKMAKGLESVGAKAGIIESERNTFGPQISACDYKELNKKDGLQEEVKNVKDKNKQKIISIIEIVSSILSVVACIVILFCPLFFNNVTVEVDGESVLTQNNYSVFNITYAVIKAIFTGSYTFSILSIMDFIRVFVGVIIAIQTYGAVKKIIKNVVSYINIEKGINKKEKTDFLGAIAGLNNTSSWGTIFLECLFLFLMGGYDGVVTNTIIATIIILIIGFILEKVAKFLKNKTKNK